MEHASKGSTKAAGNLTLWSASEGNDAPNWAVKPVRKSPSTPSTQFKTLTCINEGERSKKKLKIRKRKVKSINQTQVNITKQRNQNLKLPFETYWYSQKSRGRNLRSRTHRLPPLRRNIGEGEAQPRRSIGDDGGSSDQTTTWRNTDETNRRERGRRRQRRWRVAVRVL